MSSLRSQLKNNFMGFKHAPYLLFAICYLLFACSKDDPILPGDRVSIFGDSALVNFAPPREIPNMPDNAPEIILQECPFTVDSSNAIWDGSRKIFSGFPTTSYVKSDKKPVCDGDFVYAGLSTGELVKVNAKTRNVVWVEDIYRESNMLGGATVLDVIAPVVVYNSDVYVGGLGDAFCKLNKSSGAKRWCVNIGVSQPFVITDAAAFVVGTDNNVYAINTRDGSIYWRQSIKKQSAPLLRDGILFVGKEKFKAATGEVIK